MKKKFIIPIITILSLTTYFNVFADPETTISQQDTGAEVPITESLAPSLEETIINQSENVEISVPETMPASVNFTAEANEEDEIYDEEIGDQESISQNNTNYSISFSLGVDPEIIEKGTVVIDITDAGEVSETEDNESSKEIILNQQNGYKATTNFIMSPYNIYLTASILGDNYSRYQITYDGLEMEKDPTGKNINGFAKFDPNVTDIKINIIDTLRQEDGTIKETQLETLDEGFLERVSNGTYKKEKEEKIAESKATEELANKQKEQNKKIPLIVLTSILGISIVGFVGYKIIKKIQNDNQNNGY